jgi:hypothetical protein
MENDLIHSLCLVLKSIAMNENNQRIVVSMIQSQSFMNLLSLYSHGNHLNVSEVKVFGSSLNYDGLSIITEIIGIMIIKGNATVLFHQLSEMIYLSFDTFFHYSERAHPNYLFYVKRILACLNGLARYVALFITLVFHPF